MLAVSPGCSSEIVHTCELRLAKEEARSICLLSCCICAEALESNCLTKLYKYQGKVVPTLVSLTTIKGLQYVEEISPEGLRALKQAHLHCTAHFAHKQATPCCRIGG